jgi:hypothetical protein
MENVSIKKSKEVVKVSAQESIRNFYEKNSWARYKSVMQAVSILEQKDPEFLERTWESTKDLRETAEHLYDRAVKRMKEFGIELVENPDSIETLGLSTPEGIRDEKIDAPNFLTDPMGYEKYMEKQKRKTPFSGLTPKQSAAMLESLNEFWEAKDCTHKAHNYQFQLLQGRGMIEEIKEQQGNSDTFLQLQEKMQFPYVMLRAHLDGKLTKFRHAPKFTCDKFKSAVENFLKEFE